MYLLGISVAEKESENGSFFLYKNSLPPISSRERGSI